MVQKISLIEIISTVVLLAIVVVVAVDLSRVFHVIDSATLQVAHRCTHAPYGILAVLPTVAALDPFVRMGPFVVLLATFC